MAKADINKLKEQIIQELNVTEWLGVIAKISGFDFRNEKLAQIRLTLDDAKDDELQGLNDKITITRNDILSRLAGRQVLSAINGASFARNEYVKIGSEWFSADAQSYSAVQLTRPIEAEVKLNYSDDSLENECIMLKFGKYGEIINIKDKRKNVEYCAEGSNKSDNFGMKKYFIDKKLSYDIAKKSIFRRNTKLVSVNSYIDGFHAIRESCYNFNGVSIVEKISLETMSTQIEVQLLVRSLKVQFLCMDNYFELTKDNKKVNNSQHVAKKVERAQVVDCSDQDFGIAVFSDDATFISDERELRMAFKLSDKQNCSFSYVIYPHDGNFVDSDTVGAIACYCLPMIYTDYLPNISRIVDIDNDGIKVERIWLADDGAGIFMRFCEIYGENTTAQIKVGFRSKGAYKSAEKTEKVDSSDIDFVANEQKELYFEL